MTYPNVQLHVNGEWRAARSGKTINVLNPANEEVIGTVAHAEKTDLDEALAAAEKGFAVWKKVCAMPTPPTLTPTLRQRSEIAGKSACKTSKFR